MACTANCFVRYIRPPLIILQCASRPWGSLIFQQSSLYPYLSALDNVAFGFMLQGVGRDDAVYLADRVIILIARPG